jgi:hypothetical protein
VDGGRDHFAFVLLLISEPLFNHSRGSRTFLFYQVSSGKVSMAQLPRSHSCLCGGNRLKEILFSRSWHYPIDKQEPSWVHIQKYLCVNNQTSKQYPRPCPRISIVQRSAQRSPGRRYSYLCKVHCARWVPIFEPNLQSVVFEHSRAFELASFDVTNFWGNSSNGTCLGFLLLDLGQKSPLPLGLWEASDLVLKTEHLVRIHVGITSSGCRLWSERVSKCLVSKVSRNRSTMMRRKCSIRREGSVQILTGKVPMTSGALPV